MKRMKIGNASIEATHIGLYLNIGSWPTMQKVREALGKWLPDMPTWKSNDHYVEKSYFRNNFRWDGEYILNLPLEALSDVEQIVRIKGTRPPYR